jgi:hypothetical protein
MRATKTTRRNHGTYALAGAGLPLTELEPETAAERVASGTIRLTETGSENSYYKDRYEREYFSKNYPNH